MPSKKKSRKNSSKSRLRSTLIKAAVANSVKREINKRTEIKTVAPQIASSNRITNYLNDPATQCIPLVPIIAQGPGQGERIGNKVRTRKASLNITCNVYALSTTSGYVPPFYVDIYLYKFRRSNSVTAVELAKFLQYGNTSINYDSSTLFHSGNLAVNRDSFILKKKKRILLTNKAQVNQVGQAIVNANSLLNAQNLTMDITKYLSKNMDFQDATANTPEDNLYVSVVFTPNDYTTPYPQNFVSGEFTTMMQYSYEDL